MITRRVDGLRRIRWNPLQTANIQRALIAVVRFVGRIRRRDDVAHSIAFEDFAIHAGLSRRQIRAGGRKAEPAHRIDTRAHFTKIIRGQVRAIIRGDAPETIAHSVTNPRAPTGNTRRFIGIVGNSVRAQVHRTRVVVFRDVRVEIDDHRFTGAVAYCLFAITGALGRYRRTHRGEVLTADVVDTRARLTIIVRGQIHAIGRHVAFDTGAGAIANRRLPDDTWRSARNGRIRRRSIRANIIGTRIHIDGNIHVIHDRGIGAHLADMHLAIARRLLKSGRRHSIERRKRTRPVGRIA